ncbi:MAG: 16S rRNA (cytosine(967)-C(5))-methyltransferase RsmB, partial [Leptolyngbya sp.]|nr:16S rRNA (cytosine(967)-C(5))-methyltransferase RsmB [Candidatus Melainabacteria bacterium]
MAEETKTVDQGMASRKLALEVLIKIEKDSAYANLALSAGFERRKSLNERDRAFVTALVQGVVRNLSLLDHQIAAVSKEPLAKMPAVLRNILRMAIYQLDHMSETPQRAVLDTSAKLARSLGHEGMVRFTNGVLRGYLRKKEEGGTTIGDATDNSSLSLKYSLPVWLIEKWKENYGESETLALLAWSKKTPGLTIRVSELGVEPPAMLDILNRNGFAATHGKLVPACLIFNSAENEEGGKSFRGSPNKLPGYEDGLFVVQDEAAAFVSTVLGVEKGETIIDLCAAPGGKAVHIGELLENTGQVIAIDKSTSRLKLVNEARVRLSLTNLQIVAADGREYEQNSQKKLADRVLLDAPCSGTGVINRRTDISLNRESSDIEKLTVLQKDLIQNAGKLVKAGGVLVYSTCSMEPEENLSVVEWFLAQNPNFKGSSLLPFINDEVKSDWFSEENESTLPEVSKQASAEKGYLQLLPTRHGVSGFFICRLVKDAAEMP